MRRCYLFIAWFSCLALVSSQECPRDGSKTNPYSASSCLVLVSTLDGRLTALDKDGAVHWIVPALSGPLLSSSLSTLEFGDDAAKLIPSLDGSIFHWEGHRLELLPVTAESLLSAPFQLADGSLLVGSKDILVATLNPETGDIIYVCSSSGCRLNELSPEDTSSTSSDILIVRRIQQTIRAITPRTGRERWNFTVGQYEISLSEGEHMAMNTHTCSPGSPEWNLRVMAAEGVVTAVHSKDANFLWSHQFSSPLSAVWSVDGPLLRSWPLFHDSTSTAVQTLSIQQSSSRKTHPQFSPVMVLGSHEGQLYVHQSTPTAIQGSFSGDSVRRLPVGVTDDHASLSTYSTRTDCEAYTTEMTVYHEADFPQGDGIYFYGETPKMPLLSDYSQSDSDDNDSQMCHMQQTTGMDVLMWLYHEWTPVVGLIVVLSLILKRYVKKRKLQSVQPELSDIEMEPVDDSGVGSVARQFSSKSSTSLPSRHSDSFVSMFERDFEIVGVLGRGGFGEVYDVRKPLDECSYAVKRIRLPRRSEARERVLREVKALAKLDHPHIIRYYTSWEECPPVGFAYQHLVPDTDDTIFTDNGDQPTQRESTVNTSSHFASRTGGSSFIQFVDESQQNHTHNSISDEGLVSEPTNTDGDSNLRETETRRWLHRSTSESGPVFLYIQMELCRKETLKDWLADNHKSRDYCYVMDIFQQIVGAVEYVHTQGMMHRDLKPSNILFAINGSVKVSDFGLVKYLTKTPSCNAALSREPLYLSNLDDDDPSKDSAHITSDVGTELYMSPEQVAGQPYCEKVDVFSMGMILFELLTPFTTHMERHKTLSRVRSQQFPEPFVEKYHKEHGLICSLLAEIPSNRPSAQNLKNSLLDAFKLPQNLQ